MGHVFSVLCTRPTVVRYIRFLKIDGETDTRWVGFPVVQRSNLLTGYLSVIIIYP
jgi:hypothetical protein